MEALKIKRTHTSAPSGGRIGTLPRWQVLAGVVGHQSRGTFDQLTFPFDWLTRRRLRVGAVVRLSRGTTLSIGCFIYLDGLWQWLLVEVHQPAAGRGCGDSGGVNYFPDTVK